MFDSRRYLIIPTSITGSINFNQVQETSVDTLRLSIDGLKTFVKYDIVVHESDVVVNTINPETGLPETNTIPAGVYGRPDIYDPSYPEVTYEEILSILSTTEWSNDNFI